MFNSLEDEKREAKEAEFKTQENKNEIWEHNREVKRSDHRLKFFTLIGLSVVIFAYLVVLVILGQGDEKIFLYYRFLYFGLFLLVIKFVIWVFKKGGGVGSAGIILVVVIALGFLSLFPDAENIDFLSITVTKPLPMGIEILYGAIGVGVLNILLVVYPAVKFLLNGPDLPEEDVLSK